MDPDPGFGAFLTSGSDIRDLLCKKSRSGSGIRDERPGWYFRELRNNLLGQKYLNSLMRIRIRDPKYFWPWIRDGKTRMRDKHPGSATLDTTIFYCYCLRHSIIEKQFQDWQMWWRASQLWTLQRTWGAQYCWMLTLTVCHRDRAPATTELGANLQHKFRNYFV